MEIVTYDSPYDRFLQGETNAISAAAKRGADLFFSADMPCTGCHGGDDFDRRTDGQHGWFNTGLYELGESRYPAGREGLFERTGRFDDIGAIAHQPYDTSLSQPLTTTMEPAPRSATSPSTTPVAGSSSGPNVGTGA